MAYGRSENQPGVVLLYVSHILSHGVSHLAFSFLLTILCICQMAEEPNERTLWHTNVEYVECINKFSEKRIFIGQTYHIEQHSLLCSIWDHFFQFRMLLRNDKERVFTADFNKISPRVWVDVNYQKNMFWARNKCYRC